jgi:hypothetical protein
MTVGRDLVLVALDVAGSAFSQGPAPLYFASGDCTGSALMYADLHRIGYVTGTVLEYPSGLATLSGYASYFENATCFAIAGSAPLAPRAALSLGHLAAPFTLK